MNLLCQIEVLLRQAALAVGGQGQLDLVPTDIDVWMVIGLFRDARHFVHEIHRSREVFEFVSALDLRALLFPALNGSQSPFYLFRCQFCHDLPVAQWPLLATMPIRILFPRNGVKTGKEEPAAVYSCSLAEAVWDTGSLLVLRGNVAIPVRIPTTPS
jgi:hypothetical protein